MRVTKDQSHKEKGSRTEINELKYTDQLLERLQTVLNLRPQIVTIFSQQWVKVSNYIFYHKSITFIKSALLASEVCGNVCCCVQLVVN